MAAGESSPIYDDLMRFKPEDLTPNAWAVMAGVSRTVWTDMRRHGNPSRRTLERLLKAAGSSLAEFEALRIGGRTAHEDIATALADRRAREWGGQQLPPMPLLATSMGGAWQNPANKIELTGIHTTELIDRLPRPASLAGDHSAYAITIVGDSMWPRFRPGRRVAVTPASPVAIGDDVLVKLKIAADEAGGRVNALIKELVRKSETAVELRQFNPNLTFEVAASDIGSIEKVLGELI